jgi:hypothetical protein
MDVRRSAYQESFVDAMKNMVPELREGQVIASGFIGDDQHQAIEAPTGVGKSVIAFAGAVASGGGIISTFSNGLVSQYEDDAVGWSESTGVSSAVLLGKSHYWCAKADPEMRNIPQQYRESIRSNGGRFVGRNVPEDLNQSVYIKSSVMALPSEIDSKGNKASPCKDCPLKPDCGLWAARNKAASAKIIITNSTMAALTLLTHVEGSWVNEIKRSYMAFDEADSAIGMVLDVLTPRHTISSFVYYSAGSGKKGAVYSTQDIIDASKSMDRALQIVKSAADRGHAESDAFLNGVQHDNVSFQPKFDERGAVESVTLSLKINVSYLFKDKQVLLTSATLSRSDVDKLNLDIPVIHKLPSLDYTKSMLYEYPTFTAWKYNDPSGSGFGQFDRWCSDTAYFISTLFSRGSTMVLFQSVSDMNQVADHLDRLNVPSAKYSSSHGGRDAVKSAHEADPTARVLLACVQGGGRGLNLPGDKVQGIVLARTPQYPPRGIVSQGPAGVAEWAQKTVDDAVQGVGRGVRFDGDSVSVHVLGGFGKRVDIRKALIAQEWPIHVVR